MESRSRGIKGKEGKEKSGRRKTQGYREPGKRTWTSGYQEELQRAIKSVGLGDADCSLRTLALTSIKG